MGVRRRRLSHRVELEMHGDFSLVFTAGDELSRDEALDTLSMSFRAELDRLIDDTVFVPETEISISIEAIDYSTIQVMLSGTRYETDVEMRRRDRDLARREARAAASVESRRELYERLREEFEG